MSALRGRAQARHDAPIPDNHLTWRDRARCAGVDPELFFPSRGRGPSSGVPAQRICRRCPVQLECLQYAITHPDGQYGTWGGATETELKKLRKAARAKGRRAA